MLIGLALVTAACRADPTPAPIATPLPDVGLVTTGGVVRASGNIEPAQEAMLAFPRQGRVQAIPVAVGDAVETGDALIQLAATDAEAAVVEAQAARFAAQAALQQLTDGARQEAIEMAQAQVDAAAARLAQLAERARPAAVAAAEAEVRAAQTAYAQLFDGPREAERIAALAALSNAKAAVQQAQSAYNAVAWRADIAAQPESRALQQATNELEAAQARYDALYADPDADQVAAANARIQQAKADLDRLLTPGSEHEVAEAQAQVRSAQAELDLLTAGPDNGQIAAAAMAVTQADSAHQRAAAELAEMTLRAPFAGVVTAIDVHVGETVQPGAAVLTMADLGELRMETSDLSERDVARVAVGQPARVFVKPLNEEVPGRVIRIAPQASIIGGDVVYTVVIALDEQPPALRWGMSADVDIEGE